MNNYNLLNSNPTVLGALLYLYLYKQNDSHFMWLLNFTVAQLVILHLNTSTMQLSRKQPSCFVVIENMSNN